MSTKSLLGKVKVSGRTLQRTLRGVRGQRNTESWMELASLITLILLTRELRMGFGTVLALSLA
jgi:hypothetical protein